LAITLDTPAALLVERLVPTARAQATDDLAQILKQPRPQPAGEFEAPLAVVGDEAGPNDFAPSLGRHGTVLAPVSLTL
jgi:hypothetical protein